MCPKPVFTHEQRLGASASGTHPTNDSEVCSPLSLTPKSRIDPEQTTSIPQLPSKMVFLLGLYGLIIYCLENAFRLVEMPC